MYSYIDSLRFELDPDDDDVDEGSLAASQNKQAKFELSGDENDEEDYQPA